MTDTANSTTEWMANSTDVVALVMNVTTMITRVTALFNIAHELTNKTLTAADAVNRVVPGCASSTCFLFEKADNVQPTSESVCACAWAVFDSDLSKQPVNDNVDLLMLLLWYCVLGLVLIRLGCIGCWVLFRVIFSLKQSTLVSMLRDIAAVIFVEGWTLLMSRHVELPATLSIASMRLMLFVAFAHYLLSPPLARLGQAVVALAHYLLGWVARGIGRSRGRGRGRAAASASSSSS